MGELLATFNFCITSKNSKLKRPVINPVRVDIVLFMYAIMFVIDSAYNLSF